MACVFLGGSPGSYVDTQSGFFICVVVAACLLFAFGWKFSIDALTRPFRRIGVSEDEIKPFKHFYNLGSVTLIAAALVMFLIGTIAMLQHFEDPSPLVGPVAVVILPFFYSLILAGLVFQAMKYALIFKSKK